MDQFLFVDKAVTAPLAYEVLSGAANPRPDVRDFIDGLHQAGNPLVRLPMQRSVSIRTAEDSDGPCVCPPLRNDRYLLPLV